RLRQKDPGLYFCYSVQSLLELQMDAVEQGLILASARISLRHGAIAGRTSDIIIASKRSNHGIFLQQLGNRPRPGCKTSACLQGVLPMPYQSSALYDRLTRCHYLAWIRPILRSHLSRSCEK